MTYLIDECISEHVAHALQVLGLPVVVSIDAIYPGATDPEVLDFALREGLTVLTQDLDIGRNQVAQTAMSGGGNGLILLRRPKQTGVVEEMERILRHWGLIERLNSRYRPPFVFELRVRGSRVIRHR